MSSGQRNKAFQIEEERRPAADKRSTAKDVDDGLLLNPDEGEAGFRQSVENEKHRLRVRQVAHQEYAADAFAPPDSYGTLADELALPEEPIVWRVQSLLPVGFNLALVAKYKVGKTTLLLNLLRSLCDGEPFLDEFEVRPVAGRVGFWNYELTPAAFRRWVRDGKLRQPERAAALHLRGHAVPLLTQAGQDFAVKWLREREVEVWVVDPFGSAYDGDENSNSDVKRWLLAVEHMARRAGVDQTVIVMHAGAAEAAEGQERARGATKLGDAPDVRWLYSAGSGSDESSRYLRAHGRDVNCPEFSVAYDGSTRSLRYDAPRNRRAERLESGVTAVVDVVTLQPGIGKNDLRDRIRGTKTDRPRLIAEAIERGLIEERQEGQKTAHFVTPTERRTHRKQGPEDNAS